MKLTEKINKFFISCLILLFIYVLCPTHDAPQGYSRMQSFCSFPFYIIMLFAFIIVFLY